MTIDTKIFSKSPITALLGKHNNKDVIWVTFPIVKGQVFGILYYLVLPINLKWKLKTVKFLLLLSYSSTP